MTAVRMEDAAEACGQRFLSAGRELPLDAAKSAVRLWFEDMESVLRPKLHAEHASPEQRKQFYDAFQALHAAVVGMLQVVSVARPQPRIQDPYRDQQGGWDEQRRQERRGGNPLSDAFGWVLGPEPRRDPPPAPPRPAPVLMVNTVAVYQQVVAACRLLDQVLAAAEPQEETPQVPWAHTDEFLAEAQKLFAARIRNEGQHALDELELLENRLREQYGVEVIQANDGNRKDFTIYPNDRPGDTSFTTRKPAIAVHGWVLLHGEALGPAAAPPVMRQAGQDLADPRQRPEFAGGEGTGGGEGGLTDGC
jgi:hypothetical protein